MLPVRRCRKCKRLRRRALFRFDDGNGNTGLTGRCTPCRRSSHRHGPLWIGEPRYRIQRHAVHRYIERVRPDLHFGTARLEMIALMKEAELSDTYPQWANATIHHRYRGCLIVRDDLVFCLRGYNTWRPGHEWVKVSTVLTPGCEPVAPQLAEATA